jgi:hypothetical protein
VNWKQYVALDVTKHLVESGAVDENDFLFAGLIPVMRHIGCQFFHFWILGTGKLEGDNKIIEKL